LDSLVKERLTGAIILVVLIVLLVPELLSGPSRSAPAPQGAATSSEEPPLRSYTIDLADEPHTAAGAASSSSTSPQATGPAQPTTIVESPAAPAQPEAATVEPVPTVAPHESPAPPQAPESTPAPVIPQQVAREQPQPPSSHRSAQQAPRSNTPEAAGDWVVQLGVFAKHANADRLAQELKGQGFRALVSEVSVSGRTLWRVRAGPVAERSAAEQLGAKLRTAGHAGSVVPK
jgi:DedD protein